MVAGVTLHPTEAAIAVGEAFCTGQGRTGCGFDPLKRLQTLCFSMEERMRWIVSLTALAMAGCAAPDAAQSDAANRGERDCFNVSVVAGYETVDDDTIRLDAGPSTKYEVDLSGGQCRNVDWTQRLAIESTSSSFICAGSQPGQGNIHFRDPATQRRVSCYIDDVRRVPSPGS